MKYNADDLIRQDEAVVAKLIELQDWLKSQGIPYIHHFVFLNKLGSPVDKSHKDTPTKEDTAIVRKHLLQMVGHLHGVTVLQKSEEEAD